MSLYDHPVVGPPPRCGSTLHNLNTAVGMPARFCECCTGVPDKMDKTTEQIEFHDHSRPCEHKRLSGILRGNWICGSVDCPGGKKVVFERIWRCCGKEWNYGYPCTNEADRVELHAQFGTHVECGFRLISIKEEDAE